MEKIKEMEAECIKLMNSIIDSGVLGQRHSLKLDWKDWDETPDEKKENFKMENYLICNIIRDGEEEEAYVTQISLWGDEWEFEVISCGDLMELEDYWEDCMEERLEDGFGEDYDDDDWDFQKDEDIRYINEQLENMIFCDGTDCTIIKDEDFFSYLLETLSAINSSINLK